MEGDMGSTCAREVLAGELLAVLLMAVLLLVGL
jgi:hypothetical protein